MGRAKKPCVVSLFTGAGGLDLGLEAAGFSTKVCIEVDKDSRDTIRENRPHWKLTEPGDIFLVSPRKLLRQSKLRRGKVDLLAGGPPCQPFSKAGYWVEGDAARLKDPRSKTLSAYLTMVNSILPKVILIENVSGFAFEGKDEGLRFLKRGITRINLKNKTKYKLEIFKINAANFGVPQLRERVFIVAHVKGKSFQMPDSTHGAKDGLIPYTTAWDSIGDLNRKNWGNELNAKGRWARLLPTIPEGSNYLWHTSKSGGVPLFGWRTRYWSFLLKLAKNQPSWTIQAQPGPAIGPFHWKGRLLSVEELSRLQTFPKNYKFSGNRTSIQRQIGNAVPCAIGEMIGLEIRRQLLGQNVRNGLTLIPKKRRFCPNAEKPRKVPKEYVAMKRKLRAHPGVGLGPRAKNRLNQKSD